MTTYTYGSGEAGRLRKIIHKHIISERSVADALPTNVRSVYYVGVGKGWWPSDADWKEARLAEYDARGEKRPSSVRLISQNLSDYIQWLIDRGYVGEDEVVDASAQTFSFLGSDDLVGSVRNHARNLAINPWSPNPVPYLLAEGANDMTFIAPLGREYRCRWAPLGGMAGRSMLREVAGEIDPGAPIGYVGDANKPGEDIAGNTESFLRAKGWSGKWTRIAITPTQAAGLPSKMKLDRRFTGGRSASSVESAAMPTPVIRTLIRAWLVAQRPAVPDVDDLDRADLVEWVEIFRLLDRPSADPDYIDDTISALVARRRP